MIQGVTVTNLTTHIDDRGSLFEVLRSTSDPSKAPHALVHKYGQTYIIKDHESGIIRAFHAHNVLWDWFCVLQGTVKLGLIDDRPDSPTYNEVQALYLSDHRPQVVTVPPRVLHGWKSLSDNVIFLSTASEVYNAAEPDEYRIAYTDRVPEGFWDTKFF